jgi:hypothetical protein
VINANEWNGRMEDDKVKTEVGNLPVEAKIAIALRTAECIEQSKDADVVKGLKVLFQTVIHDLVTIKTEPRH